MNALFVLAVLFVNPDGSGQYPTIQAAVDAAHEQDTIVLEEGTFVGDGNREVDLLGKSLLVKARDGAQVYFWPENHSAFLYHSEEKGVLRGLTFQFAESEAVVSIKNSAPTIENCYFVINDGVSIRSQGAMPTIRYCNFDESWNDGNAAPCIWGTDGYVKVSNCYFSACNSQGGSGAVSIEMGDIRNCQFSGNFSSSSAGSLWAGPGVTVRDSDVAGAAEHSGGGVVAAAGSRFIRCSMSGNAPLGAGLYALAGIGCVVLEECSVYGLGQDPGACVRTIHSKVIEGESVPFSLAESSWGELKARYR